MHSTPTAYTRVRGTNLLVFHEIVISPSISGPPSCEGKERSQTKNQSCLPGLSYSVPWKSVFCNFFLLPGPETQFHGGMESHIEGMSTLPNQFFSGNPDHSKTQKDKEILISLLHIPAQASQPDLPVTDVNRDDTRSFSRRTWD